LFEAAVCGDATSTPWPRSHRRICLREVLLPPDVIVLAVYWYLRYSLSYRDIEALPAERGVEADHTTIYRWVQRFTPLLAGAARPCRHPAGIRWQADETYIKGHCCIWPNGVPSGS
jgi:transposase-like protein